MKSMMKAAVLMVVAMLLVPLGAFADTPVVGGTMNVLKVSKGALALQGSYCATEAGFSYNYIDNGDGTITLSGISPAPIGEFTVPDMIDGKRVTGLADGVYGTFGSQMTSVIIPASIVNALNSPFNSASSLTNITVAADNPVYKSVDGALYTKDGKTLLVWPHGRQGDVVVAEDTEIIGQSVFSYCYGLTTVTIPASIQTIEANAFRGCSNLSFVTFIGGIDGVDIVASAFVGTPYNKILPLPFALVVESGSLVGFCGQAPETLVISNYLNGQTLTSISYNALSGSFCDASLMKRVVVPEGVTAIYGSAFANNVALESVELPDSLRRIEYGAFSYCIALREIRIPAGVESVATDLFYGCTNLTVHAPSTLRDTFTVPGGCTIEYYDVTTHTVTFDAKGGSFWGGDYGCYSQLERMELTLAEGLKIGSLPSPYRYDVNAYAYFLGWYDADGNKITASTVVTSDLTLEARWAVDDGTFQMVVVDGVLVKCFGQCPATLSSSDWPEGVTAIADYAFSGKSTLASIAIPVAVTEIGDYAFAYCYGLTNVTISASVTSVGDYAFGYCGSLASVTFEGGRENVDRLSDTAFYNTPYERSSPFAMVVKDGVVTGFHGTCPSVLAASDWPEGVTAIADGAFAYCYGLTSVTIPAGVTSVGSGAFRGCSGLESFVVAEGNLHYKSVSRLLLTKDGHTLVAVAPSGLTSIVIPDGVTSIGDWALAYCGGLASVTFPNSVTSIGQYAFFNCYGSLLNVLIPAGVTSIGNQAFAACWNLTRAYLPKALEGVVDEASIFQKNESSQPVTVYYYEGTTPVLASVTLNANGGYCNTSSITWLAGNAIGTLPEAYKDYNQLVGWFTAAAGGEQVTAETILSAGVTTLYAHWKENDPEWYYDLDEDDGSAYLTITGYSLPLSGDVVFPASIPVEMEDEEGNAVTNDVPVRYIGESAFRDCSGLRSVTIPAGITGIGSGAFYECYGLTNVTISASVTNIGDYAFGYCRNLVGVTFEGDMGAIDMIVAYAFAGTPWLDTQPFDWITYASDGEVYLSGYYGSPVPMETLTIPDGVTMIAYNPWDKKSGLPRFDTHWDGERYWRFLGWYTAAGGGERVDPVNYWEYNEVAIAGGTTLYAHWEEAEPEWYFDPTDDGNAIITGNSVSLVGVVEIPTSVTVEEEDEYGNVTEVAYTVTAICDGALSDVEGITSVTIPASVTNIYDWAFEECIGLTNVVFAGGMDNIEMNVGRVFYGTPWLASYLASLPKPANDDFGDALMLIGISGRVTGTNMGAGVEDGDPLWEYSDSASTVWWRWTAPTNGTFTFSTRGSNFDTVLGVYAGDVDSPLDLEIVAEDDDGDEDNTSAATFDAVVGTTYYIAVGGYDDNVGNIVLSWCFVPDVIVETGDNVISNNGDGSYTVTPPPGGVLTADDVDDIAVKTRVDGEWVYTTEGYDIVFGNGVITISLKKPEMDGDVDSALKDPDDKSGFLVDPDMVTVAAEPDVGDGETLGALPIRAVEGLWYQASWGCGLNEMATGEKVQATGTELYLGVIRQDGASGFYKVSVTDRK